MVLLLGWYGELLALAAGAAMPFAFAPYGYYPVAMLSLALLFVLWLGVNAKRAFLRGLIFGLGMFAIGIHWIFISIHEYGGVPFFLALLLSALLVVYLSLFPAVLAYLLARFAPGLSVASITLKLVLIFPAAWVLSEWLRGWLFTGFPWLSVGYSQIDSSLAGVAPILGVYGVSWLLAICSGSLVLALFRRGLIVKFAYVAAIVGVMAFGSLLSSLSWTEDAGDAIKVSLIQGNIPQELKWKDEVYQPTLDLYTEFSQENWESDLIVWPETAISEFYHRAEGFIDELQRQAQVNNTDLLIGVLYLDPDDGRYYNALVGLSEQRSLYFKRHLVPFTEYLPLRSLFGDIVDFMNVPMSSFSQGAIDQEPMLLAGHPIGMSICYEDVFGEEMVRVVPKSTLLVNVSNDGWFGGSSAAYQHQQIARMRALEAGRPLLRATNTGVSSVMNHKGELVVVSELNVVDVITADVQPQSGITPYVRWQNYAVVMVVVAILLLAGFARRKRF